MDINALNGLTGYNISQTTTKFNTEQQKIDSFQATLENAAEKQNDNELLTACQEFEAYFIQYMFKEMRKTVDTSNSLFPKSQTEEVFQDMLDEEYSKSVAKNNNGIGLADMMYKQMKRNGL